jgi:NTE family protein
MDFYRRIAPGTLLAAAALAVSASLCPAQNPVPAAKTPASTSPSAGKAGAQGGESTSAGGSATRESATGTTMRHSPLDPSVPPARVFNRPVIGLALGGGGALGLTEVGVLRWFEENHIPVDIIAGTSMGCLVSALYASGQTPEQLSHVVNDRVFTSVFSFSGSYTSRSFRRREESRELPNGITVGLKHGVSFRNAVLVDQGLNAFLDREFLRYDDRTDFNTLPIPLRCVATDLNDAVPVVFSRGSIPDAVRASVSIPGIFPPFEMNGHEYVDGVVLENLPTPALRELKPDVVIAVSLPLAPVAEGQLGSILGVFGRAFSVATEAAEDRDRLLADLVIKPDITGYTVTDYFKSADLNARGYQAAKDRRGDLLKYALSDADWNAYIAHRSALIHGPAAPVLSVRVSAPDHSSTLAVQRLFAPLINQPVDTAKIEALLDQVRSDGSYDADYTVGYESAQQFANHAAATLPGTIDVPVTTTAAPTDTAAPPKPAPEPGAPMPNPNAPPTSNQPAEPTAEPVVAARPGAPGLAATLEANAESLAQVQNRPIILVSVTRRKTGPPFLLLGANVEAQTSSFTRATMQGIVIDQDFGGYGSELRSRFVIGYRTELASEYFRPLNPLSRERTVFVMPHLDFQRTPFPVYNNSQDHLADRQFQQLAIGGDVGLTNQRTQQLRAGYEFSQLHWETTSGSDGQPDFSGQSQRVRAKYEFDTQDRALVPQYGFHVTADLGYLFSTVGSDNSPQLSGQASYAHRFGLHRLPDTPEGQLARKDPNRGHEVFVIAGEGGTMFGNNVAAPFRYTLGGPLRLSASAIDQYRGTDYWLIEPALLRRIANLPQPLGQSIYLGLGAEAGQVRAPGVPVINRQDMYFGLVAETPLGVITLAPAIGSNGERKFVFTLGKLF